MKHILHVDSSEFFRKMMKTFLSELGNDSESFVRGEDVVEAVNAGKANCVITGLELQDMSGEELIKRITVTSQTVSMIVVTSQDDEAQRMRLKALGVKAIIQKAGDWKGELSRILA
jgi:two-component system cell cycle response regulator